MSIEIMTKLFRESHFSLFLSLSLSDDSSFSTKHNRGTVVMTLESAYDLDPSRPSLKTACRESKGASVKSDHRNNERTFFATSIKYGVSTTCLLDSGLLSLECLHLSRRGKSQF
jgi:hypothetical protein